ncbi:MAG TPA: bifunctional riboflavin kinase/FAD synthetase [Aestuariivirga sp.]|jgi:riboflavin kinase/FMN adenylyltransferase|nr:bifunctional riboflavin kinase/FAD synthetase [Aestuariivirga sp.]
MHLLGALEPIPQEFRNAVVAIGNFDGLHRGHQELLAVAREQAGRLGKPWGIVTFEPHPRSFFKPDEPVFRLTPLPLKARLASALGASFVLSLTFDKKFSLLEPQEFIGEYLIDHMKVDHVVTGYDFHFGRGRKGNPIILKELGQEFGFDVTIVDQVADEGDSNSPFSSSSIRSALRRGHVTMAARELGYYWTVMGKVVPGDQRGRAIGFPTANIILEEGAEPIRGIYAVRVRDGGKKNSKAWAGAGYFGDRPTFETARTFLEVHLFDMNEDLYGRTLLVEFIDLIRPDQKFNSVEDLVRQMNQDCIQAKARLAQLSDENPCTVYPLGRAQEAGTI